jgi:hypothetical protein
MQFLYGHDRDIHTYKTWVAEAYQRRAPRDANMTLAQFAKFYVKPEAAINTSDIHVPIYFDGKNYGNASVYVPLGATAEEAANRALAGIEHSIFKDASGLPAVNVMTAVKRDADGAVGAVSSQGSDAVQATAANNIAIADMRLTAAAAADSEVGGLFHLHRSASPAYSRHHHHGACDLKATLPPRYVDMSQYSLCGEEQASSGSDSDNCGADSDAVSASSSGCCCGADLAQAESSGVAAVGCKTESGMPKKCCCGRMKPVGKLRCKCGRVIPKKCYCGAKLAKGERKCGCGRKVPKKCSCGSRVCPNLVPLGTRAKICAERSLAASVRVENPSFCCCGVHLCSDLAAEVGGCKAEQKQSTAATPLSRFAALSFGAHKCCCGGLIPIAKKRRCKCGRRIPKSCACGQKIPKGQRRCGCGRKVPKTCACGRSLAKKTKEHVFPAAAVASSAVGASADGKPAKLVPIDAPSSVESRGSACVGASADGTRPILVPIDAPSSVESRGSACVGASADGKPAKLVPIDATGTGAGTGAAPPRPKLEPILGLVSSSECCCGADISADAVGCCRDKVPGPGGPFSSSSCCCGSKAPEWKFKCACGRRIPNKCVCGKKLPKGGRRCSCRRKVPKRCRCGRRVCPKLVPLGTRAKMCLQHDVEVSGEQGCVGFQLFGKKKTAMTKSDRKAMEKAEAHKKGYGRKAYKAKKKGVTPEEYKIFRAGKKAGKIEERSKLVGAMTPEEHAAKKKTKLEAKAARKGMTYEEYLKHRKEKKWRVPSRAPGQSAAILLVLERAAKEKKERKAGEAEKAARMGYGRKAYKAKKKSMTIAEYRQYRQHQKRAKLQRKAGARGAKVETYVSRKMAKKKAALESAAKGKGFTYDDYLRMRKEEKWKVPSGPGDAVGAVVSVQTKKHERRSQKRERKIRQKRQAAQLGYGRKAYKALQKKMTLEQYQSHRHQKKVAKIERKAHARGLKAEEYLARKGTRKQMKFAARAKQKGTSQEQYVKQRKEKKWAAPKSGVLEVSATSGALPPPPATEAVGKCFDDHCPMRKEYSSFLGMLGRTATKCPTLLAHPCVAVALSDAGFDREIVDTERHRTTVRKMLIASKDLSSEEEVYVSRHVGGLTSEKLVDPANLLALLKKGRLHKLKTGADGSSLTFFATVHEDRIILGGVASATKKPCQLFKLAEYPNLILLGIDEPIMFAAAQ